MAKRIITIVVCICFLLCLSGCKTSTKIESPANFYYLSPKIEYHRADGMIKPETREIAGIENDLHTILAQYLHGPQGIEYVTPFPENVYVVKISQNSGILSITLSDQFASLTGYDLSLACACITLTVQELVDTKLVQISAETMLLDGAPRITMNADSILIFDDPETTETEPQ